MDLSEELPIEVSSLDGYTAVRPSGEIDIANVATLRAVLGDVIDSTAGDLVVDLAEVTFLDSSTLGALIQSKKRLAQVGRDLRVRHPQPIVDRIFTVTGLRDYFGLDVS